MIKRYKKRTVELTSLLDLLFVMIFLSLLQTKNPPTPVPQQKPVEEKVAAKPKPIEKPTPKILPITATFNFYATSQNPGLPSGSYLMNGSFDEASGVLQLGGTSWIQRPANYDMVPLKGTINASRDLFTGRIEFQDCLQFTLNKIEKSGSTPISGTWKGVYSCAQGDTGLTLTIR